MGTLRLRTPISYYGGKQKLCPWRNKKRVLIREIGW